MPLFYDRREAGKLLAEALLKYQSKSNSLILALPRGGVPVAYEAAIKLHMPLDVYIVRKLGVPGYEELAMGALAPGGTIFLNDSIVRDLRITKAQINEVIASEQRELERRNILYRGNKPFPKILGQTVILIDDGLATGASMEVAIQALRKLKPGFLIVAVPVAPMSAIEKLKPEVDEIVCLHTPEPYFAVGQHYSDFSQTTDDEVISLLQLQSGEK